VIKSIHKYLYYVLVSIVLLSIILLIIIKVDNFSLGFSIEQDTHTAEIKIHDSRDGSYHVFLPSYATLKDLQVSLTQGTDVSLGGVSLFDGMACGDFELEKPYDLIMEEQHIGQLQFHQSANVKTMYIDTISGSMDWVHEKLGNSENAIVKLISSDGTGELIDLVASIKGRGNATWGYDKRPYALTLSEKADLAGMGAATDWILLANATDETNLNNKLLLDLASSTGLGWTPACTYVDVYLNGAYNGLYLLTEKVEVDSTRLNIDTAAGDFLCKIDLEDRWSKLTNPFLTNIGRTVEISSPEAMTDDRKAEIHNAVNQLERRILGNEDLRSAPDFDLDSWVKRYLLDEISGNIDSDIASSYFHYADGVFYAGPAWDYDMALGNHMRNQASNAFIAKNANKAETLHSPWYSALYANESFYNRVLELYQSMFLPALQQLIDSGIPELTAEIQAASGMNSLRWRTMYSTLQAMNPNTVHTVDGVVEYLEGKADFLNRVWFGNEEVCTLQFELIQDDGYWNISVVKNSILETSYLDPENTTWINRETDKTVDFSKPIVEDMILTQPFGNHPPQAYFEYTEEEGPDLAYYVTYLSIGILLLLFFCFIIVDFRLRRKERSTADAKTRRHVSP